MSFLSTMAVSASALTAQQLRMDVLSQNMANVETTRTAEGGPYRRRNVLFQERRAPGANSFGNILETTRARAGVRGPARQVFGHARENQGVMVRGIVADMAPPGRMIFDPMHPDANDEGYVEMPNVNVVMEMVDLISASRSFEANITAMGVTRAMINRTFEISRG